MAEHRKIRWTTAQREIFGYLKQGLKANDIIAKGHGRSNINRVIKEFKNGNGPPIEIEIIKEKEVPATDGTPKVKDRQLSMVDVGHIVIEPQDWKINQYGGFMIMSTHSYAKQKFGYTGTVGEFICDACQIARRVMGLDIMRDDYLLVEEGENHDGAEEGTEGERVLDQVAETEAGGADGDGDEA